MRKAVLVLCFLACFLSIQVSSASAQMVELSEKSGQEFLNMFRQKGLAIGEIKEIEFGDDKDYPTAAMSGLGGNGAGAVITVFENAAGCASKAVILYRSNNQQCIHDGLALAAGACMAAGVSGDEMQVLLDLKEDPRNKNLMYSSVWCKSANRRIVYEVHIDPQENAVVARILAYDS